MKLVTPKIFYMQLAFITNIFAASPRNLKSEWNDWKQKYEISFNGFEEHNRFEIFKQNVELVERHNQDVAAGFHKFTLKINKFAALTYDEFKDKYFQDSKKQKQIMLGYECPGRFTNNHSPLPVLKSYSDGKQCWDNSGNCEDIQVLVTAVKDQGYCGSCWTFGAAVAIEGNLCKQGRFDCNDWTGVSEQQLLDCASHTHRLHQDEEYVYDLNPFDNGGCNGGFQSNALRYLMMNDYKWNSLQDYPYVSGDTERAGECAFNPEIAITNVLSNCGDAGGITETGLADLVNQIGPVTVGMDASGPKIMFYESGVWSNDLCRPNNLDHAVSITGFGNYPYPGGVNYWEVKNSWGTDWGMNGYLLLEKDTGDQCGLTGDVQFVIG